MGCCVSTKNNSETPSTVQKNQSLPQPNSPNQDSRAPPASFEEEKVKEILLSELPKLPPLSDNLKDSIFVLQKQQNNFQDTDKDLSEDCSETVSTTTFCNNTNEYRRLHLEDENEVKQKNMKSANLQNGSGRVDLDQRMSPVRRSDQSPGRRNNVESVKLLQSKEIGSSNKRFGSRSDPNKRDPNERSGRRSRSPCYNNNTNRSNVKNSHSLSKMNGSPCVRSDPNEIGGSKRAFKVFDDTWPGRNNGDAITNESLENPLVSLECFIFL